MLSARLCKGKLPLQRSVCVFMNAACSQHRQLQRQMFANVQERFPVHLNEIICSELPPSADFSDKKKAPTPPLPSPPFLLLCLFYPSPPNKETNREPNKPNSSPVQPSTSRTVPGWGNHWNCLPPTRAPPPPKPPPRRAHTPPIFLPLSSPLSSLILLLLLLLLYKMRCPCLIAWANLQTHVAPIPSDLGIVPLAPWQRGEELFLSPKHVDMHQWFQMPASHIVGADFGQVPNLLYWSLFLCISIATDNADLLQNILVK